MGISRAIVVGMATVSLLSACGSQKPEAPPKSITPTASAEPTNIVDAPPVMPRAATAHTTRGARQFAVYYTAIVDYTERTLNTAAIAKLSAPSCIGCTGGIREIRRIARHDGHIEGAAQTVTAIRSERYIEGASLTVLLTIKSHAETVSIPDKKAVLHPAGEHKMRITLLPRPDGWITGELISE